MKSNFWIDRAARRLQRRFFLKAVGLGLAAPLAMKLSQQAFAQSAGRPKRFMLFYHPHGVPPEHFNPKVGSSPTDFSLTESGVSILGPLSEIKTQVNVLQGFKYPGAMTHEGILTFLSGFGNGMGVDEQSPRTTVEHVIGNALGIKPLLLGAIPHRQWGIDKDGKLFWDKQPVVAEKNPLKAYDSVFGKLGGTSSTGPDPSVELNEALRQLTMKELTTLQGEVAQITREKNKLQTHLDALASRASMGGGGGMGGGTMACSSKPTIAAVDALRTKAQGQGEDFFVKEDNFPDIYAAQLGIAAHALLCNAAPIVGVQAMYTNAELDFKFMGSSGAHHTTLSHTGPGFSNNGLSLNLETRTPFAKAQRWFYEQLAKHVLTVLKQPDPLDPTHTVLDNTLIYCSSEIGEGAWHPSATVELKQAATAAALSYLPLVTIGGGGGAIKTGNVMKFSPDRPASDIYLALARAMGVANATFPNSTGALTEILT
ncbi:MAG TPA: DUF1552 domain-containing protein [Polyangiaceae bacterium]|nr:DUF1552 domain-containing protein [Polyangiaceae bacterium]